MAASMKFIFARRFSRFSVNFSGKMTTNCVLLVLMMWTGMVGSIDRPRGVALEKMSLYNPNGPFTCFDGSQTIEFERVNDDYCDCQDGSDEPGTSACPNGVFTCQNKHHIARTIPSSRVNDGICDCCDGSDEYGSMGQCENQCIELGRAAREEQERKRQRLMEGNAVYLEYISLGEKAKKENKERLDQLVGEKETLEKERNELEEKKKEAETPEKEAKDVHEKAWQEVVARREAEAESARAEAAFTDLDTDQDGSVSVSELMTRSEFDTDVDGTVTEEEAKSHLADYDQVDLAIFKDNIWPSIKSLYRKPSTEQPDPEPTTTPAPPTEDPDDEFPDEKYDEDKEDYSDDEDRLDNMGSEHEQNEDEKMPEYNEDTKLLIEAADAARRAFNEVDQKFRNMESDIRNLEETESMDFGPKMAFYPLKGQCFEYTDREYTYKLCPFDKASQRPKNGGGETSLGRWGSWQGGEGDYYGKMKYEGGQGCWNGPDRSLTVSLYCGSTNQLSSVSEPSRCEYAADLFTPALCSHIPPPVEKDPQHDEL